MASTTEMYFSQFWRTGKPKSKSWQIWFLVRASFLACRQSPSCCVLPWLILSTCAWREQALVSLHLLTGTLIPLWGFTLMTSSTPNLLPKGLLIPSHLGVRASTYEFQENANVQPIIPFEGNRYGLENMASSKLFELGYVIQLYHLNCNCGCAPSNGWGEAQEYGSRKRVESGSGFFPIKQKGLCPLCLTLGFIVF